jgi:cytidyltransferase-like protein
VEKFSKVFVAGTFDGLHAGHQFFLWCAAQISKSLVVVVARDSTVLKLKKRVPKFPESERQARVFFEDLPNACVRLGRADGDFWQTLSEENPDVLFLGHDQKFDEVAARQKFPQLKILRAAAFSPEFFKSSRFR